LYPARSNLAFTLDRPITHEAHAAAYNNFYEFSVFRGIASTTREPVLMIVHVMDGDEIRGEFS
jgi:hypothetical protein